MELSGELSLLLTIYSGRETLCLVSGRRRNFEVSPPLRAGTSLRIKVKENKKGLEFGLVTAEAGNLKDYKAVMFDARAVVNVKVFKISGSSGEFRVSAVSTDGTETELKNTRTKQYLREVGHDGASAVLSSSAVGEQKSGNVSINGDGNKVILQCDVGGDVRVDDTQRERSEKH